jgi:hypothetical protein
VLNVPPRQVLSFHQLAASLSLPKTPTSLQSSKSRLFFGNTRGGVPLHFSLLESATSGEVGISALYLATRHFPFIGVGMVAEVWQNPSPEKPWQTAEVRTSSR